MGVILVILEYTLLIPIQVFSEDLYICTVGKENDRVFKQQQQQQQIKQTKQNKTKSKKKLEHVGYLVPLHHTVIATVSTPRPLPH